MIIDGTTYNDKTPIAVATLLESIRKSGKRCTLSYGDSETGRDWLEEYDIAGTIGRSTGSMKIPLMIATRRSSGGLGILDHCIVRIRIGETAVWQHAKYHTGQITIGQRDVVEYPYILERDGVLHAAFKTELSRSRYISKLGLTVSPA